MEPVGFEPKLAVPATYTVLARKYRSAQFSDVVGQAAITRTLTNAITNNRIHQAYLFTGSRGIGKTSIARIFAKLLRCEQTKTVQIGPNQESWLVSCDSCSNCREIANSSSVDVIEIDGASNNGVDAIREIRESAKFMPSSGQRKIYIIDEVHMLTTAAFNALLKTLEEPPRHVLFVFATTEPHKIPGTILSRVQRFDFKRINSAQVEAHLSFLSKEENLTVETQALTLIARASEGCMRDALSLFDQVIAYANGNVTAEKTREALGLISTDTVLETVKSIFERNPQGAIKNADRVFEAGHDLKIFVRSFLEILHGVLLAKTGFSNPSHFLESEWSFLESIQSLRPIEEVEMIFQVFHHGLDLIAHSPTPKITLDVLLIKTSTAEVLHYAEQPPVESTSQPAEASQPAPSAKASTTPTQAQAPATAPAPAPAPATSEVSAKNKTWEGFIEHVRGTRPLLASLLEFANCVVQPGGVYLLQFQTKDAYYRDQLGSRTYAEQLRNLGQEFFGGSVVFRGELIDEASTPGGFESLAAKKAREQKERRESIRTAALNNPAIIEARSLFGGELGPIEILGEDERAHS